MNKKLNLKLCIALLGISCLLGLGACASESESQNSEGSMPPGTKIQLKSELMYCCWEDLLKFAETKGLPYQELYQKALNGDTNALDKLLLFSKELDLRSSSAHAVALTGLLYGLGDSTFAKQLKSLEAKGELKQEHPYFKETMKENLRNLLESGASFSSATELKGFSLANYAQTAAQLGYTTQGNQ